jgi:hypothetical protein
MRELGKYFRIYCHETHNWKGLYHYPIISKDGDIAWRILHNRIVTPELLQWGKRTTADCPWCPGIKGTLDHMLLDCPAVKTYGIP